MALVFVSYACVFVDVRSAFGRTLFVRRLLFFERFLLFLTSKVFGIRNRSFHSFDLQRIYRDTVPELITMLTWRVGPSGQLTLPTRLTARTNIHFGGTRITLWAASKGVIIGRHRGFLLLIVQAQVQPARLFPKSSDVSKSD